MRINDSKYSYYSYQNQQTRPNKTNISKQPTSSVNVEISSRGRELLQEMKSEQTDRQKRIQELKQQIAEGTYQVDSRKIAEKLINFSNNNSI